MAVTLAFPYPKSARRTLAQRSKQCAVPPSVRLGWWIPWLPVTADKADGNLVRRCLKRDVRQPELVEAGPVYVLFAGIQYEMAQNVVLDARYAGNLGRALHDNAYGQDAEYTTNWSQYDAVLQSGQINTIVNSPATAATVASLAGVTVPYPFAGFSGPAWAAIAPYPQLAQVGESLRGRRSRVQRVQ